MNRVEETVRVVQNRNPGFPRDSKSRAELVVSVELLMLIGIKSDTQDSGFSPFDSH